MKEEKDVLTSARQDADRLRAQNGLLESQLGRAWQQVTAERTASELLRKQLAKQKEELDSVKEAGRSICMLAPEGYLLSITVSLALDLLSCLRLSLLSLCLSLLGPDRLSCLSPPFLCISLDNIIPGFRLFPRSFGRYRLAPRIPTLPIRLAILCVVGPYDSPTLAHGLAAVTPDQFFVYVIRVQTVLQKNADVFQDLLKEINDSPVIIVLEAHHGTETGLMLFRDHGIGSSMDFSWDHFLLAMQSFFPGRVAALLYPTCYVADCVSHCKKKQSIQCDPVCIISYPGKVGKLEAALTTLLFLSGFLRSTVSLASLPLTAFQIMRALVYFYDRVWNCSQMCSTMRSLPDAADLECHFAALEMTVLAPNFRRPTQDTVFRSYVQVVRPMDENNEKQDV